MSDMVITNNDHDDSTSSPNHKRKVEEEHCAIPIMVRWDPSPENSDEDGIALETLVPSSKQSIAELTRNVVENAVFHLFLQRMIHPWKHKESSHDNITYHLHYGNGYTTHLKIISMAANTETAIAPHDHHVDVRIGLYFPLTQHELHPMDTLHDVLALYPPSNNNNMHEFSLITQWNAIATDIISLTTKGVFQEIPNNGNDEKKQRVVHAKLNLQQTSFQFSLPSQLPPESSPQQQTNDNKNGTKRKLQTQNESLDDAEEPPSKRILNNNTANENKDDDASISSSSSSLVSYSSSLNDDDAEEKEEEEKEKEKEEKSNSENSLALTKHKNDDIATTKVLAITSSKTIETEMEPDKSKNEINEVVSELTTAKINEKISSTNDDAITKQRMDEDLNGVTNTNDDVEDSSSVSSDSSESSLEEDQNQDSPQSPPNISGEIDDTTTNPTNNDIPPKAVSTTELNDDKNENELKNDNKDDDNASMSSSSSSSVSSDSSSELSSSSSSDDENEENNENQENNNENKEMNPPNNTISPGEVTPSEEHVEEDEDEDEEEDDDKNDKNNEENMNDIDSYSRSSSSLPTSISSIVSESSPPGEEDDEDETKTNVPNEVAMDNNEDISHMDTPIRELRKNHNTTTQLNNETENGKDDNGQDDNGSIPSSSASNSSSSSSSVSSSSLSSSSSDSDSSIDESEKLEDLPLPLSQKHLVLSQSSQNSKKRRPQPLFDPKEIVIQAEKGRKRL